MVQSILTEDFGMRCISLKVVPNLLTVEQKETRLAVARDFLQCTDKDADFMKAIIIGDGSSVYWYNPETEAQSSQWKTLGSVRPKKLRQVWSKVKVRLMVFFDHEGSFTVIMHQVVKLFSRSTALKFFVGCMMQCVASNLHCGSEVTGSCTMTTTPPTRPTLSGTSWLNIKSHKCHSPLIRQTFFCSQR